MLQEDHGAAHYSGRDNADASKTFLAEHPEQGSTLIIGPGLNAVSETGELPASLLRDLQKSGPVIIADFCREVLDDVRGTLSDDVRSAVQVREFDVSDSLSAALHDWWQDQAENPSPLQQLLSLDSQDFVRTIKQHLEAIRASIVATLDNNNDTPSSSIADIQQCARIILHSVLDGMFACTERDVRHEIQLADETVRAQYLRQFHLQISALNTDVSVRLITSLLAQHSHAHILATFARDTDYGNNKVFSRMNLQDLRFQLAAANIAMDVQEDLPIVQHQSDAFPHSHHMSRIIFKRSDSSSLAG